MLSYHYLPLPLPFPGIHHHSLEPLLDWKQAGLLHYRFHLHLHMFCLPPLLTTNCRRMAPIALCHLRASKHCVARIKTLLKSIQQHFLFHCRHDMPFRCISYNRFKNTLDETDIGYVGGGTRSTRLPTFGSCFLRRRNDIVVDARSIDVACLLDESPVTLAVSHWLFSNSALPFFSSGVPRAIQNHSQLRCARSQHTPIRSPL